MTDEPGSETDSAPLQRIFGAERAKAFIDAVVAIAMTLLILPLMESVSDLGEADLGAAHWFVVHQWQLVSFVISFAVIASFWVNHHHLYAKVDRVSNGLLWVCIVWLLSIVWMPVATAMTGLMSSGDPVVKIVYIGTMILTSLLTLGQRLLLHTHPGLHGIDDDDLRRGMAVDIAMAVLFAVALVVAITVPLVNYYALFLLFLTGIGQRAIARLMRIPPPTRRV
nr:TMEM175 family protein [Microbacterium bovistercoris]